MLKPGRFAFFAFINNDKVFITKTMVFYPDFLDHGRHGCSTFKVADMLGWKPAMLVRAIMLFSDWIHYEKYRKRAELTTFLCADSQGRERVKNGK